MNSPMQFDNLSNNESVIINRLNDYHLIHTYSYEKDSNYLKKYAKDIVYGNKESIPLFSSVLEGETFIVSKNAYKQNEKLFDTLRQATRDRIFRDRKSTRLNSSHVAISYAVFCLKKKRKQIITFEIQLFVL